MRKFTNLLLAFLLGCGSSHSSHAPTPRAELLQNQYQTYLKLAAEQQGVHGFIMLDACDSVLFSGLIGAAGLAVDLPAARSGDVWTRNPTRDCYADGGSNSTFSRDMFLGVMWWSVVNKRLDVLEAAYQYCNKQIQFPVGGCVFGQGPSDDPRHILSPNLIDTLAEAIVYLGGPSHTVARGLYAGESENVQGFQAHLSVLHVLLRAKIQLGLTDRQLSILKYHAERQPQNALFQAAYAKYSGIGADQAIDTLLNRQLFPEDALPSTSNYCTEWLWERDFSTERDWTICPENDKIHSGGDWLFAASLILGYI